MAHLARFARAFSSEHAAYFRLTAKRSNFVIIIFGALFLILLGRAYYLATSPLLRAKANLVVANTEQGSVAALIAQADRLLQLTRNIESARLGDIRSALNDTVTIANRAALDFQAQYQAWSELRGKIKNDSSTYDALRQQLTELQRMQEGEIVRLKQLLDAAQRPSVFADAFNLFISFVLGVLGSLLASAIYTGWRNRRQNAG